MSHALRLERLRAAFDSYGLDALLVSQPESRYYLSRYTGHDLPPRDSAGYLLITRQHALLLTDARTTEQAEHEASDFEVVTYAGGGRGPQAVAEAVTKLGIARLGFESIHLPYGIWAEIRSGLGAADLEPIDSIVDDLRVIKDADELAHLQEAIDVLDRCLAHVLTTIEPGKTERQVARE